MIKKKIITEDEERRSLRRKPLTEKQTVKIRKIIEDNAAAYLKKIKIADRVRIKNCLKKFSL